VNQDTPTLQPAAASLAAALSDGLAASLAAALSAALGAVEAPPEVQPATTKAAIARAPAAVRRVDTITLLLEMADFDGSPASRCIPHWSDRLDRRVPHRVTLRQSIDAGEARIDP
jgi:hypothetical protein